MKNIHIAVAIAIAVFGGIVVAQEPGLYEDEFTERPTHAAALITGKNDTSAEKKPARKKKRRCVRCAGKGKTISVMRQDCDRCGGSGIMTSTIELKDTINGRYWWQEFTGVAPVKECFAASDDYRHCLDDVAADLHFVLHLGVRKDIVAYIDVGCGSPELYRHAENGRKLLHALDAFGFHGACIVDSMQQFVRCGKGISRPIGKCLARRVYFRITFFWHWAKCHGTAERSAANFAPGSLRQVCQLRSHKLKTSTESVQLLQGASLQIRRIKTVRLLLAQIRQYLVADVRIDGSRVCFQE